LIFLQEPKQQSFRRKNELFEGRAENTSAPANKLKSRPSFHFFRKRAPFGGKKITATSFLVSSFVRQKKKIQVLKFVFFENFS